jgi:hypothetical protein
MLLTPRSQTKRISKCARHEIAVIRVRTRPFHIVASKTEVGSAPEGGTGAAGSLKEVAMPDPNHVRALVHAKDKTMTNASAYYKAYKFEVSTTCLMNQRPGNSG